MKNLTVNGRAVKLLNFPPNWAAPVSAEFRILSEAERGLTGREERTPLSSTLRTSLSFDLLLQRVDAAAFRAALKTLGNTPVLCPFWPAAAGYYDGIIFYQSAGGENYTAADGSFYIADGTGDGKTARLSSGLMLAYEPDWSAYEVYAAGSAPAGFTPSSDALTVPVLWGRFEKPPRPKAVTDSVSQISIQFVENSPADYAFAAADLDFDDGPAAAGTARKLFPLRPNFVEPLFGESSVDIDTDEIGYGRETADVFYPQSGSRRIKHSILCKNWQQIHQLIRFFDEHSGDVVPFWQPAYVGDCELSASAAAGSDFIAVDNAGGLGDAAQIALISPTNVEPHTVLEIDTFANTVDLGEVTAAFFDKSRTVVSPLLLTRFQKPQIKIAFETDAVAIAEITFVEVAEEYEAIAGDSPGAQNQTAWLYKFSLAGYDDWLFTSHESPISYGTDVYFPRHFDHEDTRQNINLEKNNLTISSRYFWHATDVSLRNPLGYFLPFRLEAPLYLSVMECRPDGNNAIASASTLFQGQVESVNFDGPMIKAKCRSVSSIFDRQIPTLLIKPTCNYALYGPSCGLVSNAWKMSAAVVSYDGAHELIIGQPVFTNPAAERPATEIFEHFFAGGKMEAGAGNDFERRSLLDSVANVSNLKLTIRHKLENVPESIFLWPGCDGRRATCLAYDAENNTDGKFGNFENFGGFPFMPVKNPSLTKVNNDRSSGGKK